MDEYGNLIWGDAVVVEFRGLYTCAETPASFEPKYEPGGFASHV